MFSRYGNDYDYDENADSRSGMGYVPRDTGFNNETRFGGSGRNAAIDAADAASGNNPLGPASNGPIPPGVASPGQSASALPEIADPWGAGAGSTTTAAPSASAGAAAAGGAGGAMPWIAPIADALAKRQQEQDMRRQARADLASQYAQSQGDFPMYGYQAARKNRSINNAMGGPGLGTLRRLGTGLRGRSG